MEGKTDRQTDRQGHMVSPLFGCEEQNPKKERNCEDKIKMVTYLDAEEEEEEEGKDVRQRRSHVSSV